MVGELRFLCEMMYAPSGTGFSCVMAMEKLSSRYYMFVRKVLNASCPPSKACCRYPANVITHRRDGKGEVALYQYGRAPPLCPRMVSPGIGSESYKGDRVELLYYKVNGVG